MAYSSFLRVPRDACMDDGMFASLLERLVRHRVNEITFFSCFYHSVHKPEQIRAFAEAFARRVEPLHQAGIRVGINHLTTTGFFEQAENLLWRGAPFYIGQNGDVGTGSICPTDEATMAYIREIYTMLAEVSPDFIYVDDDIKFNPNAYCYCENCLRRFESAHGVFARSHTAVSWENLLALIEREPEVLHRWLAFQGDVVERIYRTVEQTVHAVDPGIELGMMVHTGPFTEQEIGRWARALKGERDTVRIRPGGGLYTDRSPRQLIQKMASIGVQNLYLPPFVEKIEAELECFPSQGLAKSDRYLALECLAYLAVGCNAIAFNCLSFSDPVGTGCMYEAEYGNRWRLMEALRPFSEAYTAALAGTRLQGACFYMGYGDDDRRKWKQPDCVKQPLVAAGIPICYDPAEAAVMILTSEAVEALDDASLRRAFERPVFLTGEALKLLNDRGFGAYTGTVVEGIYDRDIIEKNQQTVYGGIPCEGYPPVRDGVQAFWWMEGYAAAYSLSSPNAVKTLTTLFDYAGNAYGSGMLETVNEFGQRIVVSGYAPDGYADSYLRQQQLREAFDYLAGGAAHIGSCHSIALCEHRRGERVVYSLINLALDDAENVLLVTPGFEAERAEFRYYDSGETHCCEAERIRLPDGTGAWRIPHLPYLALGYLTGP